MRLFGTDGIRGKANVYPMNAATAVAIGTALGDFFKSRSQQKPTILIGQDTRLSGDMLAHAVASGISAAGVDVELLGVMPTPAVASFTSVSEAVAGVVISASHTPFDDNGIKVFDTDGRKLSDEDEDRVETKILDSKTQCPDIEAYELGRIGGATHSRKDYVNFLLKSFPDNSFKDLKVVLDCAHGATYKIAPELFSSLNNFVFPIFCEPDGTNINAHCGSQYPQTLVKEVIRHKADIGLAFDGDGDRLIAVDETGAVLSGDQIMAICAKYLLESGRLKNTRVVCTVMSNLGFKNAMGQLGIEVVVTDVGDRNVMQAMITNDASLGGEDSGHIIFSDLHTTGDGLLAALHLMETMRITGHPLSRLAAVMNVYPQELINVPVLSKPDLNTIDQVQTAISEARKALDEQGRVLVRYSGTQNQCRVMVEGPTSEITHQWCRRIADAVRLTIGGQV